MKITNAFFEQNNTKDSALIRLFECKELPAKVSYWLSRLLQAMIPLNKIYDEEKRKIVDKWGEKNEDNTLKLDNEQFTIPSGKIIEFNTEFNELLSIELDIDIKEIEIPLSKIPNGLLNSFDYGKLTGIIEFKEE